MKISEVIQELNQILQDHGDLPIKIYDPDYGKYYDVVGFETIDNETFVEILN